MKPKTIINLVHGDRMKVAEPLNRVVKGMEGGRPFIVTRVTDHGAAKEAVVRSEAILSAERA